MDEKCAPETRVAIRKWGKKHWNWQNYFKATLKLRIDTRFYPPLYLAFLCRYLGIKRLIQSFSWILNLVAYLKVWPSNFWANTKRALPLIFLSWSFIFLLIWLLSVPRVSIFTIMQNFNLYKNTKVLKHDKKCLDRVRFQNFSWSNHQRLQK